MNRHYDRDDWLAFRARLVNEDKMAAMEEHLLECDQCLNTFLDLVDEPEISDAALFVPGDFADMVLSALPYALPSNKPAARRPGTGKRSNILIAYASAAAITLFLMNNGFFNGLSNMAAASSSASHSEYSLARQMIEGEQKVIDRYADRLDTANQQLTEAFAHLFFEGGN